MVTTEALTDGNASFLRAARSGNVDKIIEHLKGNIDINTSNANGLNALHLAAKEGHVHIVTELLKRGANVNAATKKGNTALHIASLAGQAEVARMLVQLGAGVNAQSQNGFTPLYMAAQENHDDVVSFLLAHGANQSLATEDGFTPLAVALQQGHDKVVAVLLENDTKGRVRLPALHIAAKKDDCKAATLLLQSDHNPDVTSKSGFTPLHIAAHYGNENIAKILLEKGADVNYAAKHQITPLHVASKWGKMNMVLLLLEQGANIEASTRDGLTPLHCAARSGHDQVVDVLLEKGAPFLAKTKNGLAPLHMASQGDHIDSARILLYHKAPVDDVTVDYLTALHVAAHCGHVKVAKLLLDRKADANARALNGFTPLHIACKKNRIKVVELLLKHGASIEATTESGLTPLHVASFMGCMNIVIFLIQSGAHPDVPTVRGETPLHLAARANQTDIIRILLRNGASVDARAREDQTPLHIASRLGNVDIVSLLLQHGAAVDATTKDLYTALHIAAKEDQEEVASSLLDHGAALAATTKKGFTPLHLAAKYGNIKVARLLIQKSAAVDAQGKNGVTPLHVAAHYDHVNVALLLLDKGASPHATAKNGYTPLHIAAKKNQMDIASTLLEYGAKTNAESKAGFTPLHLSSQEGHVDMSSLLIENKADVNHKANNGLTPLHLCAQDDRVDVAHILVGHKAEIGPQTKAGYTPLHVASHFGQMNMVRFLLQHGANVHTTTSHGYTSLHQAAQQGHTLAVNLLLENQASPNVTTSQGQTPLSIAQRLGYISVVETLKVVTETIVTTTTTTVTEEKYKVVAPETMQETFMTDSEDEGGEEAMLGDQSYGYLTADEMKSLGDDSLPIDVTKDEKHQDLLHNIKQFGAPMVEEDKLSPQHATPVEGGFSEKFSPDNIDLERAPMHAGRLKWKTFLVSFMVDARGGAMRGCRHSGVRVIIPPRKASMPMRITCRFLRREKLIHPPPLMEGEACASRILEMGPVGAKFLGPVIIEVPHFASTRGKEREITILRSDTGETWKEHTLEASEEAVQEVLNESFEGEELSALEDLNTNRITRILTTDFPQYFAIVTRVRQEVHGVGPEGGMVSSTVVPQVQAVFPEGALTKKIRVGLQAQPIAPELVAKLLGNRVAVSPIVTVEPRRRKFHKPITLTIPVPQATTKGMINQYSGDAPTLRLLCSITGGSSKAQWEDVTGSTPLTFVNDCVSFTTTVSARFWLMDCRQVNEVTRFATELYQEAVYVPFMSKFVVFAKRQDAYEAQLRVFCMTDDREDKTLECQEHFTEIAKSRDVEVLEGKLQYLEFAGNIAPVTKSGEQLRLAFQAFHENRLPFTVRVRDLHAEPLGRVAFMREPKMGRGEPPQVPICNLNVALPETTLTEATSSDVIELVKLEKRYDFVQEAGLSKPELIHRADLRLSDIAQGLDKDWVLLARQLEVSDSDVQQIQSDTTCDQPEQALIMLRLWLQKSGSKATGNELEKGLRKINREDIIKNCMFNVELVTDDVEKAVAKVHLDQSGFDVFKEELGSSREASMRRGASLDVSYDEQDIMKDAESAAETSSETGSLFDKDQISHALTEDKVDEEGESSKNVADDENDAAVLFPKCKKSSSKHADAQGAQNGDSQPGSPVDSRYHTEEANITQKHFVKTHDFWPPDKLVEINVTEIQTIQTDSSSDTSVKTQILNKYNDEIQNVSSPKEQLPSDFTNVCEPTIADTKSELTMDLLQKRDGEQSIDPSDFGYFSMDKDSNISPNTTSDNIKFVNVSQLPDVVAHECTSPTQNITTPFPVHSMHVDELGSTAMLQSSEIEQSPIPGTENIPENHSESVETSPIQNIYPAFPTQTVQTSVQNTATFHDTPDSDLVNQELSKEDCPSPIQSIPTPFPTHSMHVKELSSTGPMYSSVSEETSIQDSETVRDTPVISDNVLSDVSAMPTDQNRLESNSDSRCVCPAEIENVIHQTVSGIITGNNSAEGNARFEDARIRRASKTPPPSPVDKPGKGGENLGKGVEILLSQSSLEEKLKETVDLANRSYDILGRDELQVRLTESETWPSLELDTSQVSISSLPDDEKSEPTTATASDAVADAAADKGITFVERIEKSEYEGPGVTSVIKTTTQMTTYSSGAPGSEEEGGADALSLHSEKEKTISPDSPELEKLSFAEKRDFFQKLSETSSSNVTPTHTLKSTSEAEGISDTLVSEDMGSAESPDEQLSFKECLKFFEKSGDSPPSPKLEIKDIKKEVWTVVGEDSEKQRLYSMSDVSDIERERDMDVVEVQEKRRSTVSIDEQVSLPLYESKEAYDAVFDSTKDAKVEVVVKTFTPGSEMLEICSVENIPSDGEETHVKRVVSTHSITSQPAGGQSIESCKNIDEIIDAASDKDHSKSILHTIEETQAKSLNERDQSQLISESTHLADTQVKESDGSMHDYKFKDNSKPSDDENEVYTFSKCSKRESSTSLVASTEHDSRPISSSEAEKDTDSKSTTAPITEVKQGSETDKEKDSKTDISLEQHHEDVVSNEEFISRTFKTISESSYEVSKSTVGAFKNNTGDKVDNKWQRESPDNISIVKDTMEPSLGKSEIFICTEETLDNVKKILSVADAESNVVINENASTSATTQEELVESSPEVTSQAVVLDDGKISSEITQLDTSVKKEEKKSEGDVFICTEETASLSKKIISEVEKETEQFLTCITKKSIENKKEDVTDHEISNGDSNEVEIVSKSIFVVDTEIQPDSSTNKDIYTSISKSTSSSLELLDNGKGDSKEEIYISASEASLEDKPEKITINSAESENKISKEDILTEVVEEVSKTKIIDPKPLETSEDNIISIERVEKEFKVETTSEHISEQIIAKLGSDVIPKEISLEISKSDEIEEKSEKEVSDLLAGKETEAYRVGKFEDKKDVEEVLSDKVAEETIIPQSQPEETSEKEVEASEDKISDIESLKRKIQSEREIGLHFEENFAGSVGSNEEKSESCLSSVKDHSVEIEFLPNLEVTGDVSESGVDKTGHDASGTPCSFHKEMDFDDRQSDLGDSFEEIERNKIINDFKLENKSPNVEKAEFEEVEKKEQASSEEMIYKESLELQHRSGKETVHSVEVTQFTVDSTAVYNVPSEKLIEKFSSKRIHFESSKDGQEKSMAPHQMNQFLESMIDQGSSMTLPSDVTPVHKRTEEWIDQSEAILLREGPLIESSEMPMFDDRLPTTLEDEPHKRSSPTAESFDDKARVEQCDTDVMMQLMDFVSRNDIELAEVRTEDEAPDIEEDVSPTAEDEGSSRMTFEDPKSESRKDSKSKESLKVTDSEILLSSPQRSPYDSTNTSPSRKDIGSDTVETVVDGMKIREGSSPRMYPQSSLEVEVGSHDSEEVGTRDPDREMTPLSFVEEESHSKVDLNIRKTSSESQAIEAKQQTETDSSEVRELTSSKKTKPSGLGDSLEGEVVSAFESTVEKTVVQENLEEYIAGLSGERSQLHTLDSDQDFERLEKEVEESVVVEPQVHAQKLHEENLHTEEGEIVVKTVPCAFDNTAFAGAEVIDEVDQNEPIRARSPYEVIRDYEVPESSHIVTEQTKHEDLGTSKTTYETKRVEEDTKGTTRTTYVSKQVEAIRHRPILQHIPSEISEEDLVEREIVSPISRRDSDVLDSPTEVSPKRVSGTHSYQEDDSNVFLSELPAGSGGLWDTSRVTQITTTRTTSRTVSEDKDSKTTEIESDRGILKESVTVTTTCQSITAPHEKESQPCLPTQHISSSEDARVLNGPGEVEYQPEYDLGGEIVQTRRSGGVYHTDRPLQISTSSSDEFKRRHYSSVSDDVLDSEIGDILRSGQQFDEDIIDRPMTPEPPIDEIEYGISISAKTLSDLTKLELDDDTIQRRVFPDFDDDQIASPPLSPDDSRAGFAYGMQFEKDVLDTVEEAMDMDSDPYSEEKEPVFDYGMRFEREPGLEDDDIRHYGDLYTHQEEDEDALENGDKVKIVAKSKRDSDFDILAGRKFFTKNVEMDELSMSSLQEFERLENELVSGRKSSVGSIDSLNGKPASKSGDHDDVSMSSLTEFERLEKECIEKEGINPSMQESTLSEIEEGHESQASETSQENKSDGCKDESSTAEGFDSHLEDIEKIILKTDSGEKEELSFQHLITQTTKSSGKTTDSTTTSMVSRMHVLQRSQDSFSKSDGRNDDIDQDSLHDELSLKPDSLADDTKHEYLDSLHEGRCDDADSLQGDMPDEMRDSLFEDRHLEDDSLRDMDILPDESSLSMESSLAAPLSHDEVVKEIRHSTQTFSKEERILEGTSGGKRAEIVVSELPKGDVMLSSTDSLEQSSSAAAAFHFESESAMSTSLTGHLQSEDNTMISSTDTLEHEGRITFRYEDIPIDDLEILIKDGRQVIVDSEGNVQTEYDVKHFLDNSADNINNEFKFCSKGFIQDTHPSGSMQVEKVMTSICYSGGSQGTETGPQPTGTFDTSYSDPEVEIEEIHTTDEFGNPKVIKKIKKVVQSRTQYTSSSSSANVEEKLKDFLREHAAGEGAGIGEELIQEERTIDDKGNVVVVRTVQQQVVSHPEVHSRTFTGKDADVLSEQYVERFKELDPTDDVCEYEKIDDQGNVVRVTQQVVIKPEVHSISFSGPDAHQQMEEYMKRFTPMPQNGSRTRAGETTYTGAQVSTATEQEYIPSESDSHDMGSTTYIKTTISNIVPESSEQFVVRTTTSTTVTSTDGTVKTNGSPEQKSSPKAD